MGAWPKVRLGDIVDFLTGYPFKSDQYTEDSSGIRLLRGDNIVQGRLRWEGVKRWPKNGAAGHEAYLLQPDDVVLAMDRPWIEAGLKYSQISEFDCPALLVQRVTRLRGTDKIDGRFLAYVIGGREFTDHVLAIQTGTAVPHISGGQIKAYEFGLPDLPDQQAIAAVLSALDDKIELNRRMNETLEASARALFRDWFVDFGPVKAKAANAPAYLSDTIWSLFPDVLDDEGNPEGWVWSTIGKEVDAVGGSTPSTTNEAYWDGDIAWTTPKDLSGLNSAILMQTGRAISKAGLQKITSGLLPVGTVLMSSRAPVGYLAIAQIPLAINQGYIAMRCDGRVSNWHAYLWANENMDAILQNANGSTFQEISKANFRPLPILMASKAVLSQFDDAVQPMFERIIANERESRTLAQTRDTLLPKLMSGEIRVAETETLLEAVL